MQGIPLVGPVDDPLATTVAMAFTADALLEPANLLWHPDATVVADGELRWTPPRLAGVGAGGEVAITASRTEVRGEVAWVFVEYRWVSLAEGMVREGRATLVVARQQGPTGWRILHAHSSSPRP